MYRNSFDKKMNTFQAIFWIVFAITAIIIVGIIALQIFIGIKVIQDPNGTAEKAGALFKTFLDAAGGK